MLKFSQQVRLYFRVLHTQWDAATIKGKVGDVQQLVNQHAYPVVALGHDDIENLVTAGVVEVAGKAADAGLAL